MSCKPNPILDVLVSLWVVFVGIVYYGGYWMPRSIGVATGRLSVAYATMILISAAILCVRFLRRESPEEASKAPTDQDASNKRDRRKLTKLGR
jgi:hypothetical protein